MITNNDEGKTTTQFHVIVNASSIEQHVIQIKNGIIKHVNVNVKIIVHGKMIIAGMLTQVLRVMKL